MKLKIFKVFANTLDTEDPERIVTTDRSKHKQCWFTIKVRSETVSSAWGYAKRCQWAKDVHSQGMVEAWRITPENKLEHLNRNGLVSE